MPFISSKNQVVKTSLEGGEHVQHVRIDSDVFVAAALGEIPGIALVSALGRNMIVDKNDPEDLWEGGGTYVFPASATTVSVVSDDNADSATLRIEGLDAAREQQTSEVVLNGTTPVVSGGSFLRVNRILLISGSTNVGTIIATVGGGEVARISPGSGVSLQAIYSVPVNKTGLLIRFGAAPMKLNETMLTTIRTTSPGGPSRIVAITSRITQEAVGPRFVAGQTDIVMTVETNMFQNVDVIGGFDLVLIDTP